MKYYYGLEDAKYIIEGYTKVNNKIIIRYLDQSTETVTDIDGTYEEALKKRMIDQLIKRNKSIDMNYLNMRVCLDTLSFSSIYILVLINYYVTNGDILNALTLTNIFVGGYTFSRTKKSINTKKDIKKTNLFLELLEYLDKDAKMNINTIDDYSYKQVKSVYRKVLKKQKTIDN